MLKVFEISRTTNHNGPGIRTLVHFKGCPLRCIWCSTPESQRREDELGFKPMRCIGDGACLQNCSQNAIAPVPDPQRKLAVDRDACIRCFTCVDECYAHALVKIGRDWAVEDLVYEIRKDEAFFRHSGGGVTFSGGEPLLYVDDEMEALYRGVREAGVSIGVDTTGYVPWASLERLLPYIDFFLWDLKHMDPAAHQKLTGVDNHLILQNLRRLEALAPQYGTRVYIRCLQIPGLTATVENLRETCSYLQGMSCVEEVTLINFHHLGRKRYEYLGLSYPMDGYDPLEKEDLLARKEIVESFCLPCKINF